VFGTRTLRERNRFFIPIIRIPLAYDQSSLCLLDEFLLQAYDSFEGTDRHISNFSLPAMTALTQKLTSLYFAYAPEFRVSAYGGCRDEALNNLAEQIRQAEDATGEGRNGNHAER
jgi:hypothetical protein